MSAADEFVSNFVPRKSRGGVGPGVTVDFDPDDPYGGIIRGVTGVAGGEHLPHLGAGEEDKVLLLVSFRRLTHHDHVAHHFGVRGVIGLEDLQFQCARRDFLAEDLLGVEGSVVVTHARVIPPDDQVRGAHVLAENGVQHGLPRAGVEHVEPVAGNLGGVRLEVQLDHLADAGVANVGGDVPFLQLAEEHVDHGAVGSHALLIQLPPHPVSPATWILILLSVLFIFTLPLAIMGMLVGKRYVFIGDDRQLPPVTTLHNPPPLAKSSVFSYLSGRGYGEMLNLTYRLNDQLTAWPSRNFYDNRLQPAPGIGERRLRLRETPRKWQDILDPEYPVMFVDVGQVNTTVRSQREAEMVVDLILMLLESGTPPDDIGVVSPYRAQGRVIRNMLRNLLRDPDVYRAIVVDTVERMQGQERAVIMVSLTTSSSFFAAELADFFFQPQRLNVTITRPRTKLIIVGSSHVLQARPDDPALAEWVKLFEDLLRFCSRYTVTYGEDR